jgi:hypothetical protein
LARFGGPALNKAAGKTAGNSQPQPSESQGKTATDGGILSRLGSIEKDPGTRPNGLRSPT